MMLFSCLVLVYLALMDQMVTGVPIEFEKVVNTAGVTVFEVHKGVSLDLPNHHREVSAHHLKLSIGGATMEQVTAKNTTHWEVKLSDGSVMDFAVLGSKTVVNVSEFELTWHLGEQHSGEHEVCFHYEFNNASWFNTYQSVDAKWPMDPHHSQHTIAFNSLLEHDNFNTVGEFLYILEQLYLNTDGFAVLPAEQQPLFVRRDPNHKDAVLCFSLNQSYPYLDLPHDKPYYHTLKLHLFSGSNIRTVTDYVVHSSGHLPKPTTIPDTRQLTYPIHYIQYNKGELEVAHFVEQLEKHGVTHSEIILAGSWSAAHNGLEFNNLTYPKAHEMVTKVQASGNYRLGLQLSQKFTTEFPSQVDKYFLVDWEGNATSEVNFRSEESRTWYLGLLSKLTTEMGIHSYSIYSMMMVYSKDSNDYTKNYLQTVAKAGSCITQIAYRAQDLPVMIQMTDHLYSNKNTILQRMITGVLSLSVGGYSFLSPIPAGYFISWEHQDEVFLRMVQASTFLPAMSFYIPTFPYDQHGQKMVDLVKHFIDLHTAHAPLLIELAKKRLSEGSPIIRPMWYVAPDDVKTHRINDQYMVGDDILVAPVLTVGQVERSVYLPTGTWVDQHGASFTGPAEIKVAAPLEELPYFKRKI